MAEATRTELRVAPRQVLGKKVKQLRSAGLTPANIYGRGFESLAVEVPTEELRHVMKRAGRNEIIYLQLDSGEPRPTFIRQVQRNPVSDAILHVDFYQISLAEKVRLEVPLTLVGKAPAVDTYGGTLLHSLDYITVEGLPADIPSHIEIEVSGLEEIDQSIHVGQLPVPSNLTVLTDPELVVAKVAPPAVEVEEEEVVEEEAAAEAAAEAGEEAAPEAAGEEGE